MLRVTFEIVPGGDESKTREVGTLEVWNTGGPQNRSTYSWELHRKRSPHGTFPEDVVKGTSVVHDRDDGPLELVRRVLERVPRT